MTCVFLLDLDEMNIDFNIPSEEELDARGRDGAVRSTPPTRRHGKGDLLLAIS